MKIKEHTRNQKRMYRIHKMEEQINKDKYIIGSQKQEIDRLNNVINELEKWIESKIDTVKYNSFDEVLAKLKELKEKE